MVAAARNSGFTRKICAMNHRLLLLATRSVLVRALVAASLIVATVTLMAMTAHATVVCGKQGCSDWRGAKRVEQHSFSRHDPRPAKWCGWWMRHHLGVANKAGNRARWWAHYGERAPGPGVGRLVVWSHHVGIITGKRGGEWVVKSGNDGHRVRERARSLRGAIAFRSVRG